MPRTVALYLRISKSDVRTKVRPGATPEELRAAAAAEALTSLTKQRRNCTREAVARYPGAEIVEFTDDGVSASKGRPRAQFTALRAEVRSGAFVAVIFDTLDRITRDRGAKAMWELAADCEDAAADFICASQDLDLATSSGELSASIMAAAARFESRRTSERVRATAALRRAQGIAPAAGLAPWGLLKEGRGYAPDEREIVGHDGTVTTRAAVVRAAVESMIEGKASFYSLKREWTLAGWPTPYGRSSQWGEHTVQKILRSPAIAGMIPREVFETRPAERDEAGKVIRPERKIRKITFLRGEDGLPIVYPGALIDVAKWHVLQAAVDVRKGTGRPTSPTTLPTPKRDYPLLGNLVRDAEGHKMWQQWPSIRAPRYACRAVTCTLHTTVLLHGLHDVVVAEWMGVFGDVPETEDVLLREGTDPARLVTIRREIASTMTALSTSRDAADISELAARLGRLRQAEDEASVERSRRGLWTVRNTGRTMREVFEAADTDGRRALLEEEIEAVVVSPGVKGHWKTPIESRVEIRWQEDPFGDYPLVSLSEAWRLAAKHVEEA